MPEFSVIIPLYNKENEISRTIESVLSQSCKDFELIVVDDGSTDKSAAVVESMEDARIRLIRKANGGVSSARNCGIRNAAGKYLCFLDADDLWMPDFLETAEALADKFPSASVFCPSYQVIYGSRALVPQWKSVAAEGDSLVSDFFEMATAPFWVCHSSCVAAKRELISGMDRWFSESETVYEDFEFWMRAFSGSIIAHSSKVCASYIRVAKNSPPRSHARILYNAEYMNMLRDFQSDPSLTEQQKVWVKEISDRRMVPYIYSLARTGNRAGARRILSSWQPCRKYRKYILPLKLAVLLPGRVLTLVKYIKETLY